MWRKGGRERRRERGRERGGREGHYIELVSVTVSSEVAYMVKPLQPVPQRRKNPETIMKNQSVRERAKGGWREGRKEKIDRVNKTLWQDNIQCTCTCVHVVRWWCNIWLLQVHVPPSLHRLNPVVILTASVQASLRTQTVHYNAIKMIQ